MTIQPPDIQIITEPDVNAELEPLYRVNIHNDHETPMDFVVYILKSIFYLSISRATEIMFAAHYYGKAYVQTLPKPQAEKRVEKAHALAGSAGYPLEFSIEQE